MAVTAVAGGFQPPTAPERLVVGLVDLTDLDDIDGEVRAVHQQYGELLRDAGHTVVPVQLPELLAPATFDAFFGVFAPELFSLHRTLLSPELAERLSAETLEVLRRGADTSSATRRAAEQACADLRARVDARFGDCDVLVLPAATTSAPPGLRSTGSPAMSTLSSLTGVPVAAIPAGLGASGRPVGMQVWGRRGADDLVLSALPSLPARTVASPPVLVRALTGWPTVPDRPSRTPRFRDDAGRE